MVTTCDTRALILGLDNTLSDIAAHNASSILNCRHLRLVLASVVRRYIREVFVHTSKTAYSVTFLRRYRFSKIVRCHVEAASWSWWAEFKLSIYQDSVYAVQSLDPSGLVPLSRGSATRIPHACTPRSPELCFAVVPM